MLTESNVSVQSNVQAVTHSILIIFYYLIFFRFSFWWWLTVYTLLKQAEPYIISRNSLDLDYFLVFFSSSFLWFVNKNLEFCVCLRLLWLEVFSVASCHCTLTSLETSDSADSTFLSKNTSMLGFSVVTQKYICFFPTLILQDYVKQNHK